MTTSNAAGPAAATRRSWMTLAILILCAVLSYTDRTVLSLLVEGLRHDLGIGDTQISLLLGGAFAATYGVAGVVMGIIADRFNRRALIVLAVAGWSIATLLCGVAHTFGELLVARLGVATCEAALTPAALSLVSDGFSRDRRGRAVSFYIASIPLGGGLSIAISGLMIHLVKSGALAIGPLAHMASWRVVLLAFGTLGLAVAAIACAIEEPARGRQESASGREQPGGWQETRAGIGAIITGLWPVLVAMALLALATNATGAWLPTVLIRQFEFAADRAGVVLGLTAAAFGLTGVLAGGWLSDRAARQGGESGRLRFCLTATLLAIPFSVYAIAPASGAVIAGAGIYLFLNDAVTSAGLSALLAFVPHKMRGTAVSVSFLLNVSLGAGIGAPAVAIVGRVLGTGSALGLALAIVIGMATVCAGAALLTKHPARRLRSAFS